MSGRNTPIIPRKRNANDGVDNRLGKRPIHAAMDETQTQHSGFPDPATNRDTAEHAQNSMQLRPRHEPIQIEDPDVEAIDQAAERNGIELPLEATVVEEAEEQARISTVDWPRLLDHSYFALFDTIFVEEKFDRVEAAANHVEWRTQLWTLFCNIPRPILNATLDGSLAYKDLSKQDPDIAPHFSYFVGVADEDQSPWLLQANHPHSPAIYVRQLVDNQGMSPTPAEFMTIVEALRKYAAGEDVDTAMKIDNHRDPDRSTIEGSLPSGCILLPPLERLL